MSRAENKTPKTAPDVADVREDKEERRLYWRRLRRRLLGAVAVFLLIGMLWQLGDDSRPPRIAPAAPSAVPFEELVPNDSLQNTAEELAEVEDFLPLSESEELAIDEFVAAPEEVVAEEESASPQSPDESQTESAAQTKSESAEEETPGVNDDAEFIKSSPSSGFAVQVGAFTDKNRAVRLARKLHDKGYLMELQPHNVGVRMFRVRAIGYLTKADATLAERDIRALGYSEAVVRDQR